MYNDVEAAFGKLTALIARRKRALARYEQEKHFRWHGQQYLREARMAEVDIRFAMFIPE